MENYNTESNNRNNFIKEESYLRAKRKLDKIKGFYWHLASYIIINIVIIILITQNETFWQFGTFATPLFWGIGLAFHALSVFGKDLLFGKDWENRKIQEFMDKDKQHWE